MNFSRFEPCGIQSPGLQFRLGSFEHHSKPVNLEWPVSKSGTANPNWEVQVLNGLEAGTGYNRKYFNLYQPGYFDFTVIKPGTTDFVRRYGWLHDTAYLSDGDGDILSKDIAVTKIKRKIARDRADVEVMANVVQDALEFNKTISGTLDTIEDMLTKVSRKLNRKHGRGARSGLVENLADLWLEFSFGINPTIADAKEMAEAIDAYLKRTGHTKRFQASHHNDMKGGTFRPLTYNGEGLGLQYHEVSTRRFSVKYITGIRYRVFSANDYGYFLSHFHFAPTDFIPTAWELLPWTWLFDYVANVGDVLSDYFQSDANDSFYHIENTHAQVRHYGMIKPVVQPGWVLSHSEMTPRFFETGEFNRRTMGALPHRIFRWRTPYEIEQNLNKKLANIVSVLIGLSNSSAQKAGRRRR